MSKLTHVLKKLKDEEGTSMASFPQFQHTPVILDPKKKKKNDKDTPRENK